MSLVLRCLTYLCLYFINQKNPPMDKNVLNLPDILLSTPMCLLILVPHTPG